MALQKLSVFVIDLYSVTAPHNPQEMKKGREGLEQKPVMLCILDHEKHHYVVVGASRQTHDGKNYFGYKFERAMDHT